ncbi:FeoB-associated Cys-rich membrane protein [Peribacillus frigoritolerans]|uniref:FeoB-associated Cys-rich membrane protein n=1 Tax=Peribacillus frigoritolerans TaxID=450367 RepID=UPI002E1B2021|nr:FeoB-associated Cys-rich membrane protein [Peribacillus frigoritolerans]MED3844688.1 FeoB-associated Cys-rich membrane protein [Peribacillus frigoritolerans]
MQYFVLALIIGVIIFSLFRMFKKKKTIPSNQYTPIDDINNGLVRNYSSEPQEIELRKEIPYEEVDKKSD